MDYICTDFLNLNYSPGLGDAVTTPPQFLILNIAAVCGIILTLRSTRPLVTSSTSPLWPLKMSMRTVRPPSSTTSWQYSFLGDRRT